MGFEEAPEARDATTDADTPSIRCASCDHRITEEAYWIEIAGAHEHTFVNPGGFVHHIGCFVAAPGCVHVGAPETAFSWFPGYSWQIASCARCRAHLGWIFRSTPEQFHGLRLVALRRG
ncbi:MAG TPA: cereblon family protein [Kofleriaceae bacterium]|nr:cereblon family protein [Kofleriaceae bacterium]